MVKPQYRLRELDFLRGIAIILVLFRHQYLFDFTQKMGWIGVDLFFVLSGFLVSGLLFKEYIKFGSIKPGLFLIRRGFKIYPVYYLFYLLYLTPILIKGNLNLTGFFSDMFFLQNYIWGWGYAYAPSWSLAVEEHFYFGFAMLMLFGIKKNIIHFDHQTNRFSKFEFIVLSIIVLCILMRIITNLNSLGHIAGHITMTHLRVDSLLAGVMVSYWYHFKRGAFVNLMNANRRKLLVIAIALVSFAPFIEFTDSFFIKTVGFTFLYSAFSIVLAWFLTDSQINSTLDKFFSAMVVNFISKVGFASYSIYIIHTFVNYIAGLGISIILKITVPPMILFLVTSSVSIFLGMLMTNHIERFFLNLRDKHYPARTS